MNITLSMRCSWKIVVGLILLIYLTVILVFLSIYIARQQKSPFVSTGNGESVNTSLIPHSNLTVHSTDVSVNVSSSCTSYLNLVELSLTVF
jgi:hypothetical protein